MNILLAPSLSLNNTCSTLQHNNSLQRYCNRFVQGKLRGGLKPEMEDSKQTDTVIQDVLMDWYEEVAVGVACCRSKSQQTAHI